MNAGVQTTKLNHHVKHSHARVILFAFLSFALFAGLAFAQSNSADRPTGVLRLRVRIKVGDATRGLSRKRFFLLKGSLDQNRAALDAATKINPISRDCFYRKLGASEALINWLRENDCESVYCREIDDADVVGPKAIPEFFKAMTDGQKEYGNKELARKWLTTNLSENLRDGFYKQRQASISEVLKQDQIFSGSNSISVMTDKNGTAYFTELEPGTYVLSNLIPTELGASGVLWNCELTVKPGDIATERPYQLSNRNDRNVKCVGVEKSFPACEK